MREPPADRDLLFRVLCARALQRTGEGFPSTDEEIGAFEASLQVPPDEKARLASRLSDIVDSAMREASGDADASVGSRCVSAFERLERERSSEGRAMAARGASASQLSPELEQKLKQIIDEDSDESATESSEDESDETQGH